MWKAFFHPRARETFREFPVAVQKELGDAILDLQYGAVLGMPLCRAMPTVAAGAYELRVRDRSGSYRAFYLIKTSTGVLVFHAFEKRTQKTPKHEIDIARKRLREML